MDLFIFLAIIAFSTGLFTAYLANRTGRRFLTWWVYGTFLFFIALPHALWLSRGRGPGGQKRCGFCRTYIPANSAFCPRCGYEFITDEGRHN